MDKFSETVAFHRDNAALPYPPIEAHRFKTGRHLLKHSGVPYLILQLPFQVPYAEMLAEAKAIKHLFVRHRDESQHKGWASVCIHGISADMTLKHQAYGHDSANTAEFHWTEIADLCPITTAFFKETFGYATYHRLRFMLLEPGGWVSPHRDRDALVDPALRSINIALNNPVNCNFVVRGAGTIPFTPGLCVMPDLCRYHSVWNQSDEERFHIIVNGKRDWSSHWNKTVQRSYKLQFGRADITASGAA